MQVRQTRLPLIECHFYVSNHKKSKEMCSYMCSQFNVIEPISAWEHSLLSSICVDYMADESKWIEVLVQSDSPRTNDHMTFRFKRQQ